MEPNTFIISQLAPALLLVPPIETEIWLDRMGECLSGTWSWMRGNASPKGGATGVGLVETISESTVSAMETSEEEGPRGLGVD
jgi:hypothetical protein